MDEYPPLKRLKPMHSSLYRINIVEEFKKVVNQVDIDAESILLKLIDNNDSKHLMETINNTRDLLISEIEKIRDLNLDYLSNNLTDSESLLKENETLFLKHCVYLDSDTIRGFTFDKNRLGILLLTDFYINEAQADSLKYFQSFKVFLRQSHISFKLFLSILVK